MVRVEYGGQKSQLTFRVVVDLATLSAQQISQVKKQLDDELEHLTNSFTKLRAAQAKFRECLRSIATGVGPNVEGSYELDTLYNVADVY